MKTSIRIVSLSLPLATVLTLASGCFVADPCGKGLVPNERDSCEAPPVAPEAGGAETSAPAAGAADGGAAEGGTSEGGAAEASTPPPSMFGKPCTAQTDCSGDAPICAAPQLPYCTQISCKPGETNAGVCPAGWICVGGGGTPTACMRQP